MRSFWLLVSLIAGAPMPANAETFDSSFNGSGKILFRIENTDLRAVAALPMQNGEIVQVIASVSNPVFLVARRYSAAGNVVNIVVPTIEWSGVEAAAVDGSGRVVVVGTIDGGASGTNMAVMRLNPDLTIDGTFSGDGLATVDYIGTNDYAKAVAIDQRDNIVIVGSTLQSAVDTDFLIVRMRSDGALDTTFNSSGAVKIPFDLGTSPFLDQANAVAIGNDGKIVIGGVALDGSISRLRVAMARLLPNGAYDTTFCNGGCSTNAGYNTIQNGRTVYYFGSNTGHADELLGIEALGTGGFAIAGATFANDGSNRRGAIARFAPSGTYDNESLQTGLGGNAMFRSVRSADATGTRLLVSGTSGTETFFPAAGIYLVTCAAGQLRHRQLRPRQQHVLFQQHAAFGDIGPDSAGVLNLDSSGRPLFSGDGIANATDATKTLLTARFTNTSGPKPDRIFRSGFN